MQSFGQILDSMVNAQIAVVGDTFDAEGYLVCGKCNTRKQHEITIPALGEEPAKTVRVPVPCECRKAENRTEDEARRRREFQQHMKALRRDGITDPAYLRFTFDQDDMRFPKVSDACRKYVENWETMRADNIGILFYGGVGTGKTFLAGCIANALIGKLVSVSVTNLPRLMNLIQKSYGDERQGLIDQLQRYSLLVIDDLGVERDNSFGIEQAFNIIDTRLRADKPLIITTNLPETQLQSASDIAQRRIFDRVLEMCPIRFRLEGESRREGIAKDRKNKARKLLGLE